MQVYGKKVAVKNLNLTMHTGITALLGHNGAGKLLRNPFLSLYLHIRSVCPGSISFSNRVKHALSVFTAADAGKSSAVSMMTGLTTPSSGDVEIMGSSIVHQPQAARRHLGYCPQSNVLFGSLTVEEHLIIYGAIKGIPGGPFSPASYQAANEAIQVLPQRSAASRIPYCGRKVDECTLIRGRDQTTQAKALRNKHCYFCAAGGVG